MARTPLIQEGQALCWWCLKPVSRADKKRHEVASACRKRDCQEKERGYQERLEEAVRKRPKVEILEPEELN
jgi:hypothetical protein